MNRELMKQCLTALENSIAIRHYEGGTKYGPALEVPAIEALNAELAKPEPVALQKRVLELEERLRGLGWEFELYKVGSRTTQQKLLDQIRDLKEQSPAKDSQLKTALDEWLEKTQWVQDTLHPRELGRHRADILRDRVAALEVKLAKFDKPLPTTAELFEIYCNDKLAGDWHRAQQNYEAGFIAALKWVASHDHHPNQTRLP